MNSLEDRVRAAARATAREVTEQDIPPMRLPGLGGGRTRGGRSGGDAAHPRVHRWLAPAAAAVAVVAVVAVAAALAAGSPGRAGGRAGGHPIPPSSAKSVQPSYPADLESGVTGEFLPASGAQYTAGALFRGEYIALESREESACMARYGFRSPTTTAAAAARGDYDLTQYPDLALIARTGSFGAQQVYGTPGGSTAFSAQFSRCAAVAAAPFARLENAGGRMDAPLLMIEARIDTSAPVRATLPGLRSCAARYGWPSQPYGAPDSTINSFADFVDWVAGHLDGASSRGATAAEMRTLDRHWARVLVTCARPTISVQERLELAQQKVFLRQHQRQFQALLTMARDAFAAAERRLGTASR